MSPNTLTDLRIHLKIRFLPNVRKKVRKSFIFYENAKNNHGMYAVSIFTA